MVDMGQADSSLYRKPASEQPKMVWTRALQLAAEKLGYDHYMDVPNEQTEELKQRAYALVKGE